MSSRRQRIRLVLAVALGAALLTPAAASVAGEQPGGGRGGGTALGTPGFGGQLRRVTLVTSDVVSVLVKGKTTSVVGVRPGPGRSRISFVSTQAGGHLRVVPSDAARLLHSGRLDARLFDVTTLLGFGFDDRRADLPLIVIGGPSAPSRLVGKGALRSVPGGSALRATKSGLSALWPQLTSGLAARTAATGLSTVWLDGLRQPSLDVSVPMIGAPAAWAAGYTGTGVKVGVVDTGVDAVHPDLAGRVIAAQDFTDSGDTLDRVGHGTHVAATIASNDSRYRGVAPGAQLLSAKVCADFGCFESAILAGMQWSAEQGAKIVNMSLGGGDAAGQDPIEAAVEDLTARFGTLFVVAAGNAGGEESIESPGSADSALTVGAVDKSDELAPFSSQGPRVGDGAIKPDITAPGVNIVAARSQDGVLGEPGDTHVALSGTSMATPHVAGSAALLLQQHPTWTPAQLKSTLMGSAKVSTTLDVFAQGAGRVDVAHAITQTVQADPASVSFGRAQWPHEDDTPITRTVTYRNTGSADVALTLSLTGGAPAGVFTLSASTLTVPAGGTASVTLTADTRLSVPDARYTGSLVAQAGTVHVGTPFAVDKEMESHDVTLNQLDRAGQPTEDFFSGLVNLVTGRLFLPNANGETLRVPKGRYSVVSGIFGPGDTATMVLEPEVTVDRDLSLTLDARRGDPVRIQMPQPDAVQQVVVIYGDITTEQGDLVAVVYGGPEVSLFAGSPDPRHHSPAVHSLILGLFTKDGADPAEAGYVADVMWRQTGSLFQGFTRRVRPGDLATITAEHVSERPALALLQVNPEWPEGFASPISPTTTVTLPGRRVEYLNTDDGIRWNRALIVFDEESGQTGNVLLSLATRFEGGRQYPERRNLAVYGPGFSSGASEGWISRHGDTMSLQPTLVNDQLNWAGLLTPTDTMRITLERNGRQIFEGAEPSLVDVPGGTANYRLGVDLTRAGFSQLSTSVSCVWTFRSGTVSGDHGVPLPLSAVRFKPKLDEHNAAPAGTLWPLPIEIQRQPGSAAGSARTLTVEVSYDDGATWRSAPVVRHDQIALALLIHPRGAGFVSLRASSTDSAGNTVRQTIIRAYRIG